jgi:alkylation response protein AidB-like acyl-CoA dehydrogenase
MDDATLNDVYPEPVPTGRAVARRAAVDAALRLLRQSREGADFGTRFAALAKAGLLVATVPDHDGGLGMCGASAGADLFRLLETLGTLDLSIGRVFEAHVNALDLVRRYGSAAQFGDAARAACEGILFGLWVTDPPGGGIRMIAHGEERHLAGAKHFCSAAGLAGRALMTAGTEAGTRMVLVEIAPPARVTASSVGLSGMQAAATGRVAFDGMIVPAGAVIGQVDDYLREPVFSAAAWRNYAVILGGTRRLIAVAREMLRARGRTGHEFQRMRFGEAVTAYRSAYGWLHDAAIRAEAAGPPGEDAVAFVNLARGATETACLDIVRLMQRSLGVGAFIEGSEIERLARDITVYLRQPGPDEALTRAGAFCLDELSGDRIVP